MRPVGTEQGYNPCRASGCHESADGKRHQETVGGGHQQQGYLQRHEKDRIHPFRQVHVVQYGLVLIGIAVHSLIAQGFGLLHT